MNNVEGASSGNIKAAKKEQALADKFSSHNIHQGSVALNDEQVIIDSARLEAISDGHS